MAGTSTTCIVFGALFFMKQIPLTRGLFTTVDDCFYEELSKFKWQALKVGKTFYATRKVFKNRKTVAWFYMHRVIMGATESSVHIDHRDNDGLNNVCSNLRVSTKAQNGMNRGPNKNNKSGFKGVCWGAKQKSWTAQIKFERKMIPIGNYDKIEDAAFAYNEKAKEYFGEFAWLNDLKGYVPEGGRAIKKNNIGITGYRGVTKCRDRFHAKIAVNKKMIQIGAFSCPIEAAKAYDKKSIEFFGVTDRLNFPVV